MAVKREQVIRTAEKYVAKGKIEAAIKEYRKVLSTHPNDVNTLNRVGDLYARIERIDEATRLFSQIAEQYTRDGFLVKAIAIYKKIIKLDPGQLQVYERLAELYHKQGLMNEATTQYQVLADYYHRHDNASSALTIYQRMAEISPDNPSFRLRLAELYETQQLRDRAITEYRYLAKILLENGTGDEAIPVLTKVVEMEPEDLGLIRDCVEELRQTDHAELVEIFLARATDINPQAASLSVAAPEEEADPFAPPEDPTTDVSFELDIEDQTTFEEISGVGLPEIGDALEEPLAELEAAEEAGTLGFSPEAGTEPEADAEPKLEAEPVFTLDLDDDEVPESLVQPPSDLLDDGRAWDDTRPAKDDQTAQGEATAPEMESMELDLEEIGFIDPADDTAPTLVDQDPPAPLELDLEGTANPFLQEIGQDAGVESTAGATEEAVDVAAPAPASADAAPDDDPPEPFFLDLDQPAAGAEAAEEPALQPSPALDLESSQPLEAPVADQTAAEDVFGGAEGDVFGGAEGDVAGTAEGLAAAENIPDIDLLDESSPTAIPLEPPAEASADPAELGAELPAAAILEDDAPQAVARQEEDLFAEAEVFAKYGLYEKAQDRLQELLALAPSHAAALGLLCEVQLSEAPPDEIISRAQQVAELCRQAGEPEPWKRLRAKLVEAGYPVDGDQIGDLTPSSPKQEDRIAQLLEDLDMEMPVKAKEEKKLFSLADELDLDDIDEELQDMVPSDAASAAPEVADSDPQDSSGMSWLDEVQSEVAGTEHVEETLFEDEDDFFDLAAALEEELDEADAQEGTPIREEQSLQEIIDGFKQGVAENLSAEDYDTHFNLGIAYREMGLVDEAIGEFQLASKDDRYLIECSSLLATCFLEKGLSKLAFKWYRKGLESPQINDTQTMGLLYDMGNAYMHVGDEEAAYKTFVEIYGMDSNFRDISQKIEDLGAKAT